jgi:ferredoxin-thioredoxin reductase catalytic subunit
MAQDSQAEADMLKWANGIARKNGWVLNPDKDHLRIVIRGLVRNKEKFGRPYCPCRLRSGDEERDRAIECPCIYHKDEIAHDGHCHCLLYYKNP